MCQMYVQSGMGSDDGMHNSGWSITFLGVGVQYYGHVRM